VGEAAFVRGGTWAVARHVDVRILGWAFAGSIALLAAGGAVDTFVTPVPAFELEGEVHDFAYDNGWKAPLPVLFSGGVLLWASLAAFELSRPDSASLAAGTARVWALLAGLFCFMAVDELFTIHELLEKSSGVDWQQLYAPVALVAGLLWIRVLLRIRRTPAAVPWVAGAACWLSSQALEAIRWGTDLGTIGKASDDGEYPFAPDDVMAGLLTLGEETLEMLGSCLLLGAMLLLLTRPTEAPAHEQETRVQPENPNAQPA
jgi:hypothetical protein